MKGNSGAKNIVKARSDISNFLIHLTKSGSYEEYTPFMKAPGHYIFKDSETLDAKDSLQEIIKQKIILARSPFGHFKFQISVGYKQRGNISLEWLQSICFSESPLQELSSFYLATQATCEKVNNYQKYGLAFSQQLVRFKGGHPVIYFDANNDTLVKAVDAQATLANRNTCRPLLPLYESFGKKLHSSVLGTKDYRWEREWRHVGHFKFQLSEVAFGLCPQSEIPYFETLAQNQISFIDPDWSSTQTKDYLDKKGHIELLELFS